MASSLDVLQLVVPILLILLMSCAIAYYVLYKYRQARAASLLPIHEKQDSLAPAKSHHRRRSSIYVPAKDAQSHIVTPYHITDPEKRELTQGSSIPSNVPEIRVTYPEEFDSNGKQTAAERVVVVHLNEKGAAVGMEPVREEQLPAYQRFESLDLQRLGGLKEKEIKP